MVFIEDLIKKYKGIGAMEFQEHFPLIFNKDFVSKPEGIDQRSSRTIFHGLLIRI